MRAPTRSYAPLLVGIAVFLIDCVSKFFVHQYLPVMRHGWSWYPYGGIGVFQDFFGIEFSITHQVNSGAAWGLFADYQLPLLYLRIALIVILLIYTLWFNKHTQWSIPLALIIAGAVGNVFDYYVYGHVVDMFHFVLWGYDCPVFNVADTSIFFGVLWLFIASSCEKPKKAARRS